MQFNVNPKIWELYGYFTKMAKKYTLGKVPKGQRLIMNYKYPLFLFTSWDQDSNIETPSEHCAMLFTFSVQVNFHGSD